MIFKFKKIFIKDDFTFFYLLIALSLVVSIVETIGISAIMPFVSLATDFSYLESTRYVNDLFLWLGLSEIDFISLFGVSLIAFYFLRSSLTLLFSYVSSKFTNHLYSSVSQKLFKKYLALSLDDFYAYNTAELTRVAVTEAHFLAALIQSILTLVSEAFIFIFLYFALIYMNFKITLTLTIFLIIFGLLCGRLFLKTLSSKGKERSLWIDKVYRQLNETFGNFKMIKLSGHEHVSEQGFKKTMTGYAEVNVLVDTMGVLPRSILESFGFIILILIVLYTLRFEGGDSVLPIVSMFALALYRMLPSVNKIVTSAQRIIFHKNSLDEIYGMLSLNEEQIGEETIIFQNQIELKSLNFSYSRSSKSTLNNINLCINKGDKVSFVGESGAGKSTVVDLILGLLNPSSGLIKVDNKTLLSGQYKSWRKKIGYIPQNIYLFDGSVSDNIVMNRNYDEEKLISVLEKTKLYDVFVNKEGLETKVGENGSSLSGGQKQRVAIARALYGDPEILVLDEATSALDKETEEQIIKEIFEISKSKTLIAITHRIETLKSCNKVFEIKNGSCSLLKVVG